MGRVNSNGKTVSQSGRTSLKVKANMALPKGVENHELSENAKLYPIKVDTSIRTDDYL